MSPSPVSGGDRSARSDGEASRAGAAAPGPAATAARATAATAPKARAPAAAPTAREGRSDAGDGEGDPPALAELVPDRFAIDLCNRYFEVRRTLREVAGQGDARTAERARACLADFDEMLGAYGIECLDLTGREYDPGRRDFESLAGARPVVGLSRSRICMLERPAVRLRGRLIQAATGLVEEPA